MALPALRLEELPIRIIEGGKAPQEPNLPVQPELPEYIPHNRFRIIEGGKAPVKPIPSNYPVFAPTNTIGAEKPHQSCHIRIVEKSCWERIPGRLSSDNKGQKFNSLNNVIGLIDQDGNTVMTCVYDAWGSMEAFDNSGNVITPFDDIPDQLIAHASMFGYRNQLHDLATGEIYMRHRQVIPELGIFTTPDPLGENGGTYGLYSYVSGDPIQYSDFSGLRPVYDVSIDRELGIAYLYEFDEDFFGGQKFLNAYQVDITTGEVRDFNDKKVYDVSGFLLGFSSALENDGPEKAIEFIKGKENLFRQGQETITYIAKSLAIDAVTVGVASRFNTVLDATKETSKLIRRGGQASLQTLKSFLKRAQSIWSTLKSAAANNKQLVAFSSINTADSIFSDLLKGEDGWVVTKNAGITFFINVTGGKIGSKIIGKPQPGGFGLGKNEVLKNMFVGGASNSLASLIKGDDQLTIIGSGLVGSGSSVLVLKSTTKVFYVYLTEVTVRESAWKAFGKSYGLGKILQYLGVQSEQILGIAVE